jgi:hypothetical protein
VSAREWRAVREGETHAASKTNSKTPESFIVGVGASGALLAGAAIVFVTLVGLVSFNVWPSSEVGAGGGAIELATPANPPADVSPATVSPRTTGVQITGTSAGSGGETRGGDGKGGKRVPQSTPGHNPGSSPAPSPTVPTSTVGNGGGKSGTGGSGSQTDSGKGGNKHQPNHGGGSHGYGNGNGNGNGNGKKSSSLLGSPALPTPVDEGQGGKGHQKNAKD